MPPRPLNDEQRMVSSPPLNPVVAAKVKQWEGQRGPSSSSSERQQPTLFGQRSTSAPPVRQAKRPPPAPSSRYAYANVAVHMDDEPYLPTGAQSGIPSPSSMARPMYAVPPSYANPGFVPHADLGYRSDSPPASIDAQTLANSDEQEECMPLNAYAEKMACQYSHPTPERTGTNIYVGGQTALNPNDATPKKGRIWTTPYWIKMNEMGKAVHRQCLSLVFGVVVLWIPGLVAILCYNALKYPLYVYPGCFGVGLFWWSTWLSSVWAGMWVCSILAYLTPTVLRYATRLFSVPMINQQILYLEITRRYFAILLWSLLVWITYLAVVWTHFPGHDGISDSLLDPLTASNNATGVPSSGGTSSYASSSSSATSILGSLYGVGASSASGNDTLAQSQAYLLESSSDAAWLITFSRFFFGVVICSALLIGEKLCVQSIAHSFHEVTYRDRIDLAKFHTGVLVTLYTFVSRNAKLSAATDLRAENVEEAEAIERHRTAPFHAESAMKRMRDRTQRDWRFFRNLVSLRGKPVRTKVHGSDPDDLSPLFNPFTPEAIVESTLESAQETRKLALRIFDVLATPNHGEQAIVLASFFALYKSDEKEARRAFSVLDMDNNGSCTWDEMRSACLQIHRERISLLASMHDIDSAVAKLDHIMSSIWLTLSCVIIAALLSVRFSTLILSLGTILLGLSWLVSSTAQEALASLVWVFCKHPIDVGDVIVVPGLLSSNSATVTRDVTATLQGYTDGDSFEVDEIQLLSTVLRTTSTGKHVQVSNYVLAQKPLVNLRRSGPIEELFTISVAYETSLDDVERLRIEMRAWIQTQGRDFRPGLDIAIDGIDDQAQLRLTFTIRYKSNWQDSSMRLRRRNRWIAALKQILARRAIRGPNAMPSIPLLPDEPIRTFEFMEDRCESDQKASKEANGDHVLKGRSRLNAALRPIPHTHDRPTMYRRHSATTTHVDVQASARHEWKAKRADDGGGGGGGGGDDDVEQGINAV